MNWDAVAFNWNHLRAFLVTVEEGSLSAASRALRVSQPTLGRQVSALEAELGVALFERVGSGLTLTPSGRDLADFARSMGDAAMQFSRAASGQAQLAEGSVCISVGELFAAYAMPPIIAKLREAEPGIEIEIVASNVSSDLKRREADIAIRANYRERLGLTSVEVGQLASRFYASADYLRRTSAGERRFIGFNDTAPYRELLNGLGFKLSDEDFPIRADSHMVHWSLARQGLGIVTALELIGDADDTMERVWPEMPPIISPMHLVAHREVMTSRRIRLVFDFLQSEIAALAANEGLTP